jgi:CRP/FNR family transcriptional regulator, cyclic AMP receptor protein
MADAISLVDADPDLGDLLSEHELDRARREALARVQRLSPGEWDAAAAHEPAEHHRGFLVIDGLLSRTVDVLGRHCVELVGHGDVMRPWSWDDVGSQRGSRRRPSSRAA